MRFYTKQESIDLALYYHHNLKNNLILDSNLYPKDIYLGRKRLLSFQEFVKRYALNINTKHGYLLDTLDTLKKNSNKLLDTNVLEEDSIYNRYPIVILGCNHYNEPDMLYLTEQLYVVSNMGNENMKLIVINKMPSLNKDTLYNFAVRYNLQDSIDYSWYLKK